MGASDPPRTTCHPGLRENLHGLFAVNLGVNVPEVGEAIRIKAKARVSEPFLTMRTRPERRPQERTDIWWRRECSSPVIVDVQAGQKSNGFPFFETSTDREDILESIGEETEHFPRTYVRPLAIAGIVYATHGATEKAARCL